VQQAFAVDRSIVNLNNGGVSPSPAVVLEAMKRHLDYSNAAPAHTMWNVLEPQREGVRQRLAAAFGCDAEEMALVRNASEGLEICQLGFDLRPGDEVLASNQDYPRMLTAWRQRERRDGIVLKTFSLPVPAEDPDEVVDRFARHLGARTRLILVSHVVNLTGQILPVEAIARLGRERGVPVIVDGAHSFAHFPFRRADLECDFYASSLHKWLFAPHGTGLLYVRRERIPDVWPLMAAPVELDADIRKFEEIGTHPAANHLAIAEALTFHQGIGPERKAARLRYLRDRWARRLLAGGGVRLHTSLRPEHSCALATVQVEGLDSAALARHLWQRHRILVTPIQHPEFEGVRVTPSVYTTLEEIDYFGDAVERVIATGLPAS
jgi:selenocysteine lyase/cysteine desulfurase